MQYADDQSSYMDTVCTSCEAASLLIVQTVFAAIEY